jgi:glutamyl/glutaminyl-tRNA synthetase
MENDPVFFDMKIRSRIAPTPSGYLHIGNAVNFLITWVMVHGGGGKLKLRIDDADGVRSRPEFVEDIFRQLDWLGITWDEGPDGPDDFRKNHSQLLKKDRYRSLLEELRRCSHLFACSCSRKDIQQCSCDGLYPGTCRSQRRPAARGRAMRVHVPQPTQIRVNDFLIPLCQAMGDFVLWRKDDQPAYQLASLADDIDDRINLVVRGEDLLESTAAQLFLAKKLDAEAFLSASFHHHGLISDNQGNKFSKSDKALSLKVMRQQGVKPATVYRAAARQLGANSTSVQSLDELLKVCRHVLAEK